jgi:alpha-glucosidase
MKGCPPTDRGQESVRCDRTSRRQRSARPRSWWQHGVVYQVYPRSFQDSDADGVGDLPGVLQRVDYFQWLGVDAVWISPIFPSPMADFGYDVSDYTAVDTTFGSLADLDLLVSELRRRGIRLLLDLVPNHTSDRHPWFRDARSGRRARHRSWYIWRDPRRDGSPPNGWLSVFGGSAWEWDEPSGQYYFHSFLKEQPDLDWSNPEVRAAMADVMRFWLDRGIGGFRVDVISLLAKGRELQYLPDAVPLDPAALSDPLMARRVLARQVWGNAPEIHEHIAEMRRVVDEYRERVLIGEIHLPPKRLVAYYGTDLTGLHLPFNFQLLNLPWEGTGIYQAISGYEALLPSGAWPNWVLGNHDRSRIASRVGPAQARVAAVLLLTLRGTPTLYYGDEIGMTDIDIPAQQQRDPQGRREAGISRDVCRTPMRWTAEAGAGFTTGRPWLPIGPDLAQINVAAQRDSPASILSLHRRLLQLRRREPALSVGEWQGLGAAGSALAYVRSYGERRFLVCLNLSSESAELPTEARGLSGRIALAASASREGDRFSADLPLPPDEGLVVLLDQQLTPSRRRPPSRAEPVSAPSSGSQPR